LSWLSWLSKQAPFVLPVKPNHTFSHYSRPLVASMLIGSGLLQLVAPVLAEGTTAGTTISNTATASYEDPSDPNKPLNTISNTVVVTVAEVAGVTVTADTFSITKAGGNSGTGAEAGDTVNFDFTVTNVGNDPSKLRIPGTATLVGAGQVTEIQYQNSTGVWTPISSGGDYTSDSKAPGGSIKVRVIVNVLTGAAPNSIISVTLGKTLTPNQQNVVRNADGGDVYTVDNGDTDPNETPGVPVNGVREASATNQVTIGATPQAFATVTKVRNPQDAGTDATTLADDSITYDLALKVAGQADVPSGSNKIAADLEATPIKIKSGTTTSTVNRILVADAVPTGAVAQQLTVPSGWTAVYTTSALSVNANAAEWQEITTPTTSGGNVYNVPTGAIRVGFISSTKVTKGTTTGTFKVKVGFTTAFAATGGKIANIAQVFGRTDGTATTAADVYDESGDSQPNNFNDDGTAPSDNSVGNGVANPDDPNPDTGNDNSGTGPAGEPNVYTVTLPGQVGILNGTQNRANAVGPTGDNDDFTNISAPVPTTAWSIVNGVYQEGNLDPAAVPFANTFATAVGSGTTTVKLLPTAPTGNNTLLSGTKVTITYGSDSKTYTYNGTKFVNFGTTVDATPLVITGVAANTPVNYGVEVDLPGTAEQLKGYSVPITAFIGAGNTPATSDKQNITIDRVYIGYLKLEKAAQILDVDGTTIIEDFIKNPTKQAQPGQMIRYRITYQNISESAPANGGSRTLSAQDIVITEDGKESTTNLNNWYSDSSAPTTIITNHRPGSASDTNGGTISFNNGAKTNGDTDISVYKNTVGGPLLPQQSGSFFFTRVVR
jgi:hypothetical protein